MVLNTLKEFEDYILQFPLHQDVSFNKNFFNKEVLQQYKSIWADNDGQIADYRMLVERNGTCIHIKEYDDIYKVHWDKSNPSTHPLGHLLDDAPHHIPAVILGIVILAGIGYYLAKK